MKKKINLRDSLFGITTGALMAFTPLASHAQYKTEAPIKPKPVVSSNFVPVKSFTKTINYSTMKPVQELQETVVNYVTPEEGFSKGLTYAPAGDHFYDGKSSEMISNISESTTGFYGDGYLNNYIQPNLENGGDFHLSYYGSGNVTGPNGTVNDSITWADYDAILGSTLDEADVDIDGNPGTQADKDLLFDYLTDQIPRLPAHWQFHQTVAEKEDMFLKYYTNVNQVNTYPPGPDYDCDQYGGDFQFQVFNLENPSASPINWNIYHLPEVNEANIAGCQVSTKYQNGDLHTIVATQVGENPLNFNDYYFLEPQNDQRQYGGDASLNDFAHLRKYVYFWNDFSGQYVYNMRPIVNFDLDGNGQPIGQGVSQDTDLVLSRPTELTYVQENITGTISSDTTINYGQGTTPEITGTVTGEPSWTTVHYMDSTNLTTDPTLATTYNGIIWRGAKAVSDSSHLNDYTYGHFDPRYNRPAQEITVQDTTAGTTNNPGTQNLLFTQYPDAIPDPDGWDECGYWTTVRNLDSTNRIMNVILPEYYNFTDWYTDVTTDPSGNSSSESFEVNVSLDNHYWTSFPANWSHFYQDPLTPSNTGGLPTADNPVPEIDVITNPNPEMINSTYSSDPLSPYNYNWGFDWNHNAADEICYDTIWGTQHVNVYKPNALVWTNPETIQDTFYLGENDIVHPSLIYEPEYQDSLETWWDTYYTYVQEAVNVTPTDSIFELNFTGHEDITNTSFEGPDYIVKKARHVGINENGLEKKTKDMFLPYPNPTHSGKLNVRINSQDENLRKVYWEAYDIIGNLVDHSKAVIHPGLNEFEIDLHGMQKGVYLLRFKHTDSFFETSWIVYF